jgi:hypothetical protein
MLFVIKSMISAKAYQTPDCRQWAFAYRQALMHHRLRRR